MLAAVPTVLIPQLVTSTVNDPIYPTHRYLQSVVIRQFYDPKPVKPLHTFDLDVIAPLRVLQEKAAETAREAVRQAEVEAQAQAAAKVAQVSQTASTQPVAVSQAPTTGSCDAWMGQAGITDKASALVLIMRESGCNPNARNGSSGACGMGQQLPCGKWPHVWNDPVGGLIDAQAYVFGSYGTWANALAHSNALGWY